MHDTRAAMEQALAGLEYFLGVKDERRFLEGARDSLRAALAARPLPVREPPEGWQLVPVEPTAEMAAEGQHWVAEGWDWPKAVYRAMVKVAPSPDTPAQAGYESPNAERCRLLDELIAAWRAEGNSLENMERRIQARAAVEAAWPAQAGAGKGGVT